MLFANARSVAEHTNVSPLGRTWTPRVTAAAIIALAGLVAGCGGKPFNVKPRPSLGKTEFRASGEIDGVGIQAEALTDEDYLFEIFDANLIQAGVYPVHIRMTNNGTGSLELKRAKFGVKSAAGKRFRVSEPRRTYKHLISYYELSLYSKDGYKRSLSDFTSYAFDTRAPLAPGESRVGILFFLLPSETAREGELTLEATRLNSKHAGTDSSLELKLK